MLIILVRSYIRIPNYQPPVAGFDTDALMAYPGDVGTSISGRRLAGRSRQAAMRGTVMRGKGVQPLVSSRKAIAAFGLLLCFNSSEVQAQDYPSRPITLIVPYTAGGGNDAMARVVADKMSMVLGQQIVIENRGGAGGSIATRQVARAAPDGYTLGLGGTGTLAIDPTPHPNVGYDPPKDFAPVGLIATSALVLLINPAIPVKTVAELIALAKKDPGNLNYASAGIGSGIHLGA